MYGSYAAVEAYDNTWSEAHFPLDSAGNLYRAVRDLPRPTFFGAVRKPLPTPTRMSKTRIAVKMTGRTWFNCIASWARTIFSPRPTFARW